MTSNILNLTNLSFSIIYLVEEEKKVTDIVVLLKEFVSNIVVTTNIESTIKKLQDSSVHLLIVDLKMTKNDSCDLLREVRAYNRELPIVLMTSHTDFKMLSSCVNYGIEGCFEYPLKEKELFKNKILEIRDNVLKKYQTTHLLEKYNINNFLVYGEHKLIDYLESINSAVMILIKIEEFKYLNFSLKSKITKKLQKRFAKKLFSHMPKACNFQKIYLLEEGEYVLVKPLLDDFVEENFIEYVKEFQENVNSAKIKIGLIDYTLSIVCSLSYGENSLEKAKAGLRSLLESKKSFILSNELLEKEKERAVKKLQTFKMLQKAINSYNIVSYFQPIVNNRTKEIEKYESLVRLIDEKGNIVSPYFFLDIAKESRYYYEITSIVLRNSFRALFETDMGISINLSTLDISQKGTRKEFFTLLDRYKTETHRITVELMEDEGTNNSKEIQAFVDTLKSKGVKVAIDDFGKGFSNFSRVLTYQPDYIKIDGSLIKNIEENSASRNMVETIVYFSKKQGIETIAEYVENENIYNILCEIGVDYSQGFYFGKAQRLKRDI